MKYSLLNECLLLLKRNDVKKEIYTFLNPFLHELLKILYPYIYLCLILVFISFLLILGTFILILRINKNSIAS